MAPTQKKEPTPVPPTGKQEGEVYITSAGDVYQAPTISAQKLSQYRQNYYGAGITRKLQALFFGDVIEVGVEDRKGNQDKDLTAEIENMLKASGVRLWDKMKIDWADRFWFGMSFFNIVWEQEGAGYFIDRIRRLPPESFAVSPMDLKDGDVNGAVLKGVVYRKDDGRVHYYQADQMGEPTELTRVTAIKAPTSTDVAGLPEILPLTGVLTMLDFAWKSQMQTVNRLGAPIFLLRIIAPKGDDIAYGQKLIRNWGKDTAFILRENMEIVEFNFKNQATSLQTIEKLTELVLDYWVPTGLLTKDGALIGGGKGSELDLLYKYIAGVHRDIEAAWEEILQEYLDANGYEDYRINLTIPDPALDNNELKVKQAEVGKTTGTLTINEIRTRLGADEMSDEEIALLPAYKDYPKEGEEDKPQDPAVQPGQPGGAFTPAPPQAPGQPGTATVPAQGANAGRVIPMVHKEDHSPTQAAIMAKEQAELVDAIDRLAANVMKLI